MTSSHITDELVCESRRPLRRAAISSKTAILLIAAITTTWHLTPLRAATAKMEFNDSAIKSAVKSELHFEMPVFPNFLDVSVSQGIVTLSGSVDNMLAKRRPVKIAASVRGVLGVIDLITVKPEPRADENIRKDIQTALLDYPATESYMVSVSVNDGVARLTGTVTSEAESRLVQEIAEGVRGVKDVRNNLILQYLERRSDQEIAADIQAVLHLDIWGNDYPIRVWVKNGNVTLTGTVGSLAEKHRANWDAWVNGALRVDDGELKVEPTARDHLQRANQHPIRSDGEIKGALQRSLGSDPRVSRYADEINITVEDGVPLLQGEVGDLKAKSAAGADARNIVGVPAVDNELSVQPGESLSDDADTQKRMDASLHRDPLRTNARIEAAVIDHVAYLNGSVDSSAQTMQAQDIASRTKDVVEVRNHLQIETEPDYFFYGQPI